jgi:RNA polymerase sigma-70 factor (ECF subfamily)
LKALARFDGRSSFGTWIYRIATNTCIDEMRRRRRRPVTGIAADVAEVADTAPGAFGAPGLFVVPPPRGTEAEDGSGSGRGGWESDVTALKGDRGGGGVDPADIVAARVDVDVALASLPLEFRTAVVLRDVCDLPYDEIAGILGVPVGTVRSRIARARTALAATWHGDETGNRSDSPDVKTTENNRGSQEERTP